MREGGRGVVSGRRQRQALAPREVHVIGLSKAVQVRKRAPSITNVRVSWRVATEREGAQRPADSVLIEHEDSEFREWEVGPHCFIMPLADLGIDGFAFVHDYEQIIGQIERVDEQKARRLYGTGPGTMARLAGNQMRRICFKVNATGDVFVRAVTLLDMFESRQDHALDYGAEAPAMVAAAISLAWKVESILYSVLSVCCVAAEVFEARALVTPKLVEPRVHDLLKTLGYNVTFPVASTFLRRFLILVQLNKQETLIARYALDLAMTDNYLARLAGSCLAAAAIAVAMGSRWSILVEVRTGYSWEVMQPIEARLRKLMETANRAPGFISRLYSHPLFAGTATVWLTYQRPATR